MMNEFKKNRLAQDMIEGNRCKKNTGKASLLR